MSNKEYVRYEEQYIGILKNILDNGFRELNQRTGEVTIRTPAAIIQVDLQKEFPILTTKSVNWKSALHEILWIMQKQSNNVNDLVPHIWDEWADDDGSIGKAYGYQAHKRVNDGAVEWSSQVHYVLGRLAANKSDRRAMIELWNVDDMRYMNLVPCCHTSTWTIIDNKLNCLLDQRSADMALGVPFNTTQYALLTILFARHLGVEPGILTHVMADAHIYEKHESGIREQIGRYDNGDVHDTPTVEFLTEDTDFFNFRVEDINLKNYVHEDRIPFEVVV